MNTYLNSSFLINSTMISFSGQICNILRIKHKKGAGRIFPPETPLMYFNSTALSTTNSAKRNDNDNNNKFLFSIED